jgi:hypothetical protein
MRATRRFITAVGIGAWLGAAAGAAGPMPDPRIDSCVSLYRFGEYQKTIDTLVKILPSVNGTEDSVRALLLLGSAFGMLDRIDQAKQLYGAAIGIRPSLEIDTLENPPNIAIIFRQVKLEKALALAKAAALRPAPAASARKNLALPVTMLIGAVGLAGVGGYFFLDGNSAYQKYRAIDVPDQNLLDTYYTQSRNSYIIGTVSAVATAVLLPVSIYLLVHQSPAKKPARISTLNGWPALVVLF